MSSSTAGRGRQKIKKKYKFYRVAAAAQLGLT